MGGASSTHMWSPWYSILKCDECEDSDSHGNQGDRHAHIANDFKGESDRVRETERCCTQQYGKVCEVGTFTHCDGGVGEGVIPSAASVRPLPNTQGCIFVTRNSQKCMIQFLRTCCIPYEVPKYALRTGCFIFH